MSRKKPEAEVQPEQAGPLRLDRPFTAQEALEQDEKNRKLLLENRKRRWR